jgi:hypothetical protein
MIKVFSPSPMLNNAEMTLGDLEFSKQHSTCLLTRSCDDKALKNLK